MLIKSGYTIKGIINRLSRTPAGIWFRDFDLFVPKHRNVLAVLRGPQFGGRGLIIPASNLVGDAGDLHYAQRAVSESLTNAFDYHYVATAGPGTAGKTDNLSDYTEVAASAKQTESGYPLRNDTDPDNTGAGVDIVTHLASWGQSDFSQASITHGLITNFSPATTEPILTGYAFAATFSKTTSDTLKVFVNHEMSGQ